MMIAPPREESRKVEPTVILIAAKNLGDNCPSSGASMGFFAPLRMTVLWAG
jgi:hypothetical protein